MSAQAELSKSERTRGKPPTKRADESTAVPFADELALSLSLDAAMLAWQRKGRLGFFVPAGEWAQVLAAAAVAPRPEELIFPGIREARLAVFRGFPVADYLRQHLGLDEAEADPALSQAGHAAPGTIASARYRIASAGGGTGAHLPHAVGAAMAARALKRSEAVLALAVSVAADTDDCHVALNFASVFRAPVVFVFRTEGGAAAGEASAQSPGAIVRRASAYAIPAEQVSGDDPFALRERLAELMSAARSGKGPAILEVSQPSKAAFERAATMVTPAALTSARTRCEEAFREALRGKRPGPNSMIEGVFSEPSWPLLEQARELVGEPVVNPEEI